MKILGRDPAVFFGLTAAIVQLISATATNSDSPTQGIVNAVIVALAGFLTAWKVSAEAGFAALAGLVKAVVALALAFGAHLNPELQSAIMVAVTALGAFFTRTQVTAPVTAEQASQ